jgi:hypothetical protein
VSISLFFVDAFTSALDRGIASANDIIRHVTPEVLSIHLPRNLWARLLTACLGAARVDATTIVDTVGIPNLCEHMPKPLLWTCLAEIAATALGGAKLASAASAASASAALAPAAALYGSSAAAAGMTTTIGLLATPPAPAMPSASATVTATAKPARGSSPDMLLPPPPASTRAPTGPIEAVLPPPPDAPITDGSQRAPTRPPMRGLGTSRISSAAGASSRRPQAGVLPTGPVPVVPAPRSTVTPTSMPAQTPRRDDLDFEIETDLRADWKGKDPIPVDDEQLVDWSANEETASGSSIDPTKR